MRKNPPLSQQSVGQQGRIQLIHPLLENPQALLSNPFGLGPKGLGTGYHLAQSVELMRALYPDECAQGLSASPGYLYLCPYLPVLAMQGRDVAANHGV